MKLKLFIDDERFPVTNDWVIVRSSTDAIKHVQTHGMPAEISFDHDLGGDDTSMVFLNWLSEQLIDGTQSLSSDFKYSVHSQNPIGVKNIQGLMVNLIKHFTSK